MLIPLITLILGLGAIAAIQIKTRASRRSEPGTGPAQTFRPGGSLTARL